MFSSVQFCCCGFLVIILNTNRPRPAFHTCILFSVIDYMSCLGYDSTYKSTLACLLHMDSVQCYIHTYKSTLACLVHMDSIQCYIQCCVPVMILHTNQLWPAFYTWILFSATNMLCLGYDSTYKSTLACLLHMDSVQCYI